ncbi:MAG: sodium-dependent transporter, partial [Alphaproteobacteria bacterium]|nr:sodium-dependent transporter [Alphaproteobacteria bacterium]
MKQVHWGSKLGFILATAGSAIGLGNIWRFPYLVGQYGGGSFLLLYILCVIGLGYFLLLGKLAFGRVAQTNIVDGFAITASKNKKQVCSFWGYGIGGLAIMNALLVTGVYVVVIGWTLSYWVLSTVHLFGAPVQINTDMFKSLTSSFGSQMIWGGLCILMTSLILIKGVKKGIERISFLLMPF